MSEAICGGNGPGCRFAHPGYDNETSIYFPATRCARVLLYRSPSQSEEGAGNAGCWPHPRGLACKGKCTLRTQATTGSAKQRHSLRNGVTAYTWSPRCAGLVSHRRPAQRPAGLDPSVGGPGQHDFAVRIARARLSRRRVHRIPPPTLVTIAKRPSSGGGTGAYNHEIPKNGRSIFLGRGLDVSSDKEKFLAGRRANHRRSGPAANSSCR
jgi:hypothetical protein